MPALFQRQYNKGRDSAGKAQEKMWVSGAADTLIEVERARSCRAEAGACESRVCLQVSPLLTIIAFSVGSFVHTLTV